MAEHMLDKERLRMRRLKLRLSQQRLGELIGKIRGMSHVWNVARLPRLRCEPSYVSPRRSK